MYLIMVKGTTDLTGEINKLIYHKVFLFKPSKKEIDKAIKACGYKGDGTLDTAGLDLKLGYEIKILKVKFSLW